MKFLISHFYIFLSVIFAVTSQLIIKWKMSAFYFTEHDSLIDKFTFAFTMLLNPWIMLSIFMTLLSGLSWMIAMTKFDLSYAYPFTALGFVMVVLFSALLFREPLTYEKIAGLLFVVIGIYIASRSI